MDLQINGKRALITASSKGLGKEIALTLAREGAEILLCSRNEERLRSVAREIKDQTGQVPEIHLVDLTERGSVEGFIKELHDLPIDILIYNVGGPPSGEFVDLGDSEWDTVYNAILLNYAAILKKLLPGMASRQWGRVLTVASVSVRQPLESLILSNVFRPAVAGLNKTLSNQFASSGITFNTICPGGIYTSRIVEVLEKRALAMKSTVESLKRSYMENIPMKRFGEPKEVADAVAFLVSQRASFITGTCLSIDGGMTKSIF